MSVAEMERRFYELKGKFDVGAISEEEFKRQVETLRFQDAQNRWWMIGAQSGKWYMYNGTRWIPGAPPSEQSTSTPPPPEMPAPVTPLPPFRSPTVEIKPATPQGSPVKVEPAPAPAPIRRAPRPSRLADVEPKRFGIPGRGLLLVGCAALLALMGVVAFVIALDNFVPSRPISSLVSAKPPASSSTTRTANAVNPPGDNAAMLLNAGDEFLRKSLFDAAVEQYRTAAQMAPSSPLPLIRWSRAEALRGNLQDAIVKAQQAAQRSPNDAEAQAQLARVMAWSGQWGGALPIAERAVQIDPKSANAHAYLAEIYLAVNRPAEAMAQAQMAVQLAPQSAEAHHASAWALTLTGQKDAATAEWRQTVALEPDLFFRHFEFAEVNRVYLNSAAEAVPEYVQAIGLYGAFTPLYSRLGRAFLSLNQPKSAQEQFQKAIALNPTDDEGYAYLGIAHGMAKDCLQAIPYLEQALRLNANNAIAANGLVSCRAGQVPALPPSAPPAVPLVLPTVAPSAAAPQPLVPPPILAPPGPPAINPTPAPVVPTPGTNTYPSGRIIFPLYNANANTVALFQASAADGGGRLLVADNASSASIRSDGALLLFANWAPGQRGIWVMQADGSNRYALTEGGEPVLPSLSPDGSAFVFGTRAGQGELATGPMRIMVGSTTRLNKDSDLRVLSEGQAPTWGPNNRIAYKPCGQGGCGLALMTPDGNAVATLAKFEDTTVPAWSPDGTKIVIGARTGGEAWNLFLIDVARGSALQLTNQLATDGPATFSPDGKSLAFLSSRGNRWGIWAMNADGSNLHKLFDLGGTPIRPGEAWWEQRIVWVK